MTSERLQPRLGEHSFEVLREAGFSESEIEALAALGAAIDASAEVRAAELRARIKYWPRVDRDNRSGNWDCPGVAIDLSPSCASPDVKR
jgi:hypothetical protein